MFWPHISLSSRDGCRNTAVNVPTDYTDYSKHNSRSLMWVILVWCLAETGLDDQSFNLCTTDSGVARKYVYMRH